MAFMKYAQSNWLDPAIGLQSGILGDCCSTNLCALSYSSFYGSTHLRQCRPLGIAGQPFYYDFGFAGVLSFMRD